MRIMYDYQTFGMQRYGGISRYFFELYKGINADGNAKVDIPILFSSNYYLNAFLGIGTIREKINNGKGKNASNLINKIYAKNKIQKYGIVHPTYYDTYAIDVINRLKQQGKKAPKLVCTIHDMAYEHFPEMFWDAKQVIEAKKRYIYESDLIVAVSEYTKADILKFYPNVSEDKIKVVYHGSSMKVRTDEQPTSHAGKPYVLYVGSRGAYKNFDTALSAFAQLAKEMEIELICAGGGRFSDDENAQIEKLGLLGKVWQKNCTDKELEDLYDSASCFIFPSKFEGFGIPILEAWSRKCPLVLADASCFKEIAGEAAVYFKPDDSEAAYRVMKEVIDSSELREKLIKEGSKRLESFSWEKAGKAMQEVYETLEKDK